MKGDKFVAVAQEYRQRGFNIIPIVYKGKNPSITGWKDFQTRVPTDEEVTNWVNDDPEKLFNIGIITGQTSNLTVVDIDGEEGYEALKENGIELPPTLTAKTRKGCHYYYAYTNSSFIKNNVAVLPKVDIRTQGGLVVAPPSVHETGFVYSFIDKTVPIAPFPDDLLTLIASKTKEKVKKESGLSISKKIAEGNRNHALFKEASYLKGRGYDDDTIVDTIRKLNADLENPLPDFELDKTIFKTILKYDPSREVRGLTDYDNALRMADFYTGSLCYIEERRRWAYYNGRHWAVSMGKGAFQEKFIAMLPTIPLELPQNDDNTEAIEDRYKFATTCRNSSRINAGEEVTRGIMGKSEEAFDQNHWLLNVRNGTLDLKTQTIRPHDPKDLVLTTSNITYDPQAKSPLWDRYIEDIFGDNPDLLHYMQKAVGYTLTGANNEKAFFVLYGASDTGKSVFILTIGNILGGFYDKGSLETFTSIGKTKSVRNDLAGLKNARMVYVAEPEEGDRLDESLIKNTTGGEPIKCRFLYGEDFCYQPNFKIWFSTNHLPQMRDSSDAIVNRIKILPFLKVIPKNKQDRNLIEKLRGESSGILNWCLEGLRMYLKEGLTEPKCVMDLVKQYKEDNDVFGSFIKDCLVIGETYEVDRNTLFETFDRWCTENGNYPKGMSRIKFYKKLRDRGYMEHRYNDRRVIKGIKIKTWENEAIERVDGNVIYTKHKGEY
jgi:P4 family phage/plasmid primase-like protien